MDTLTVIGLVVVLLVLVAPIIEIAVKRPRTFLEMEADTRDFAEMPVPEDAPRSPAPTRAAELAPADDNRLADLSS
ncbi:MAG: hypothetical protein AB7S71_21310 [Dongiaceae bacterium]